MVKITIKQRIKAACEISNITLTELANKMGMSQQSMSNRLKTGKFTQEELEKMAKMLGCKYVNYFEYPNGTRL